MLMPQPNAAEGQPQKGNVASLINRLSKELSAPNVPHRPGASDIRNRRARVRYSYTPCNEDELRLEVEHVIDVLGVEEEGWWKGRLQDGTTGVFPSEYVEMLHAVSPTAGSGDEKGPPPVTVTRTKLTRSEESDGENNNCDAEPHVEQSEIQPKKVGRIGYGDIFSGQKIELRSTKADANKVTVKPVKKSPPSPPPEEDSHSTPAGGKGSATASTTEYAKVLFEYTAEHEDELSLAVGDYVAILSKSCEDSGWWSGELGDKKGVFPDNFVVAVPLIEVPESFLKASNIPSARGNSTLPAAAPATTTATTTTTTAPTSTSPSHPHPPAVPMKPKSLTARVSQEPPVFPVALKSSKSQDDDAEGDRRVPKVEEPHRPSEGGEKSVTVSLSSSSSSVDDSSGPRKEQKRRNGIRLLGLRSGSGRGDVKKQAKLPASEEVATRLNHPAQSRPRQQKKRPPSQHLLNNMREESNLRASGVQQTPSPEEEKPLPTAAKPVSPKPPFGGVRLPGVPTLPSAAAPGQKEPKGQDPKPAQGTTQSDRAAVGSSQSDREARQLKAEFETFKAEVNRRLADFDERFKKLDETNVKL